MAPPPEGQPLHILVLVDRDWTHHDAGGNGANIHAQVTRWVSWGHRVTVVAGSYPGAKRVEHYGPRLTVHRAGNRATVFPLAILTVLRGVGRDADVVLEVINGITFLTPLWLRKPRVAMVHHVHRELYMGEFGRAGLLPYWLLEKGPLSTLYRRTRVVTISNSARDDLARDGIPRENVTVEYLGLDADRYRPGIRAETPRIVFVGRLKAYKNVEWLFDVIEELPGVALDVVGEGDHRPDLEQEIRRRGLADRVVMHGYVDHARKTELYGRAWVNMTASQSEGWSLAVIEAAICAHPHGGHGDRRADRVGGRRRDRPAGARQGRLGRPGAPPDRGSRAARAHGRGRRAPRAHLQLGAPRPREPRGDEGSRRLSPATPVTENGRFVKPQAPLPEPQGARGTSSP